MNIRPEKFFLLYYLKNQVRSYPIILHLVKNMFRIGVFLNTENCEQRHLICSVVLYSHQHGILYSEVQNHVKAAINITNPHNGVKDNSPLHKKFCLHPHWFLLSVNLLFLNIIFTYIYKICASQALPCILRCYPYGILECANRRHVLL